MTKLFISVALIFVGINGFTQSVRTEKGYIAVHGGLAAPVGDFGAIELNEKSGFAEPGINVAVEGVILINNYFGVGATFGKRINTVDTDALTSVFQSYGATITASKWKTNYALADAVLRYPIDDRISVYAKGGIGKAWNTAAEIVVKPSGGKTLRQYESKDSAPAYAVGLGFRNNLGKIGIGIEGNYFTTRSEFVDLNNVKYNQQMNSLNFDFMLSISF